MRKFAFTKTTAAAEMATSDPEPMAMPTSATARAGESLMPSPTVATVARKESPSRHDVCYVMLCHSI